MSSKLTKMWVKEPGKEGHFEYHDNKLNVYQEIVGGYIETVTPPDDNVIIICNDIGKMAELEPNFMFFGDFLAGTVVVVGISQDGDDFADCPYTREEMNSTIKKWGELTWQQSTN